VRATKEVTAVRRPELARMMVRHREGMVHAGEGQGRLIVVMHTVGMFVREQKHASRFRHVDWYICDERCEIQSLRSDIFAIFDQRSSEAGCYRVSRF